MTFIANVRTFQRAFSWKFDMERLFGEDKRRTSVINVAKTFKVLRSQGYFLRNKLWETVMYNWYMKGLFFFFPLGEASSYLINRFRKNFSTTMFSAAQHFFSSHLPSIMNWNSVYLLLLMIFLKYPTFLPSIFDRFSNFFHALENDFFPDMVISKYYWQCSNACKWFIVASVSLMIPPYVAELKIIMQKVVNHFCKTPLQ